MYILVEVCLKDLSTAHENDAKSKNIDGQDKGFILLSNYTTATHQKITCSIFTLRVGRLMYGIQDNTCVSQGFYSSIGISQNDQI